MALFLATPFYIKTYLDIPCLIIHALIYLCFPTKNKIEKKKNKNALYLSVNVFSTKVPIGDTILMDRHFTWSSEPSSFISQLRLWVLVRPRKSNPRSSLLQSGALLTELILPTLQVVVEVEHEHKKSYPFFNLCLFPNSTSLFCVSFIVLSLCVMNFQCLCKLDFFYPFVKLY